jgi:hypothetical protein
MIIKNLKNFYNKLVDNADNIIETANRVFVTPAEKAAISSLASLSINVTQATLLTTNTSTVNFLPLDSMTLTPVAGTYLVNFNCIHQHIHDKKFVDFILRKNTAQINGVYSVINSSKESKNSMSICDKVTVNGTDTINIAWKTEVATANVYTRTLTILKIA